METIVEIYDALRDYFMRECKMIEDQFDNKVILNNDVLVVDNLTIKQIGDETINCSNNEPIYLDQIFAQIC